MQGEAEGCVGHHGSCHPHIHAFWFSSCMNTKDSSECVCFLRGEGLWKGNGVLVSRNVGRAGPTGSTVYVFCI